MLAIDPSVSCYSTAKASPATVKNMGTPTQAFAFRLFFY